MGLTCKPVGKMKSFYTRKRKSIQMPDMQKGKGKFFKKSNDNIEEKIE